MFERGMIPQDGVIWCLLSFFCFYVSSISFVYNLSVSMKKMWDRIEWEVGEKIRLYGIFFFINLEMLMSGTYFPLNGMKMVSIV